MVFRIYRVYTIPEDELTEEQKGKLANFDIDHIDQYQGNQIPYPYEVIYIVRYKCSYEGCDEYFDRVWIASGKDPLEKDRSVDSLIGEVLGDLFGFGTDKAAEALPYVGTAINIAKVVHRLVEYGEMIKTCIVNNQQADSIVEILQVVQDPKIIVTITQEEYSESVKKAIRELTSFKQFKGEDYSRVITVYDDIEWK